MINIIKVKKPTGHFQLCEYCNKSLLKGSKIIKLESYNQYMGTDTLNFCGKGCLIKYMRKVV